MKIFQFICTHLSTGAALYSEPEGACSLMCFVFPREEEPVENACRTYFINFFFVFFGGFKKATCSCWLLSSSDGKMF